MFIVSKALPISNATVIVRAGGAIWLNPFSTVLFSVCSVVTVDCCVLYNGDHHRRVIRPFLHSSTHCCLISFNVLKLSIEQGCAIDMGQGWVGENTAIEILIGVTLDRTHSYKQYIQTTMCKMDIRNKLPRKLKNIHCVCS